MTSNAHPTIHDLPGDERPRERIFKQGPEALSSTELLAIILRTGTAQENVLRLSERILAHYNGICGLAAAAPEEMEQIKGLGRAKVAQIMAALELGKRVSRSQPDERPKIANAADAARLVMDMDNLHQEHVRVILLDSARRVIAIPTLYIGTVSASLLRVSEIYREAVARGASAIIVAHNHPSGDPTPSPEDIEVTHTLISAGKLLDIALLDHLIIGKQSWRSIRDSGLAFKSSGSI